MFAVLSTTPKTDPGTQSKSELESYDETMERKMYSALEPLQEKLDAIDLKVEKTHTFLMRGPSNVFKDIAIFAKDTLKCPICVTTTRDEIPHATACCNHIFCIACVHELVIRQDEKCPLCKQRRGPLYPILLSGMKELVEKVLVIPDDGTDVAET